MIFLSDIFPSVTHSQSRVPAIICNLIFWIWIFFSHSPPVWAPLQLLKLWPLCKICTRIAAVHSEWESVCRSSEQRRNLGGSRRALAQFLSYDFIMNGDQADITESHTELDEAIRAFHFKPSKASGRTVKKKKMLPACFLSVLQIWSDPGTPP